MADQLDLADRSLDDVTHQLNAQGRAALTPMSSAIRWLILTLFGVALIGGLAVHVIKAKSSLVVYTDGDRIWEPRRAVALRVKAFGESPSDPIAIKRAQVTLTRVEGARAVQVLRSALTSAPQGAWQGVIHAPSEEGVYQLKVYAEGELIKAQRDRGEPPALIRLGADTEVRVASGAQRPLSAPLKLASTPITTKARRGAGALSMFAAEQQVTLDLGTDALIVAQDPSGAPWRGEVNLRADSGYFTAPLPEQVKTDEAGIGVFKVGLQSFQGNVEARASIAAGDHSDGQEVPGVDEPLIVSETYTSESFVPRAHTLNLNAQSALVSSGASVALIIESALKTPDLYLDLWWAGRWISTSEVTLQQSSPRGKDHRRYSGQTRVSIPQLPSLSSAAQPQLIWAQVSSVARLTDRSCGGAYLLWTPAEWSRARIADWLRARLLTLKVEPYHYWDKLSVGQLLAPRTLRLALGRLARPEGYPQILINSGESARETARLQRAYYFDLYLRVILALGLVVFSWIGGMFVRQYRALSRSLKFIDAELSDDTDDIHIELLKIARRTMWLRLVQLLIFVLTFFGLMLLIPSFVG